MATPNLTTILQNWSTLVTSAADVGTPSTAIVLTKADETLYLSFHVGPRRDLGPRGLLNGRSGHVNFQACSSEKNNTWERAHVTLEKFGKLYPGKINYWYEMEEDGVDGRLKSQTRLGASSSQIGSQYLSQIPQDFKGPIVTMLNAIYAGAYPRIVPTW